MIIGITKRAYDNCLALAEDDHYFRTKGLDDQCEILDDRIIHQWHPWSDVAIKTTIVPLEAPAFTDPRN